MSASLILCAAIGLFLCAYRFYAHYLSHKIMGLVQSDQLMQPTPANALNDNIDYCPSEKSVLFGHHFSSIAGAAPIVGPAVAAIWGWAPALCWIVFGVIFMGACHDFGALVVSMRYQGQSMAIVAEKLIGPRVRNLLLIVIFFLVLMVIAVFALVIANLFVAYPSSVIPVNFEIIVALLMGRFINKKKGSLKIPSILAQVTLYIMIYLGTIYPISLAPLFGAHELMAWMLFLLFYSFIASTLPVWLLLQPRDYINGHQLVVGLFLMIIGLFIVNPDIVAPAINVKPEGAPSMFPFLFITIACGAISGFHALVASGTTAKQVKCWQDAKSIGYGSMLGEGLLALLATLAVTAGFKSELLWHNHYASWSSANGLSAKINAFVSGSAHFISGLGISEDIGATIMAVLVISFAATSLDTATRIQRYIIGEFGQTIGVKSLDNRYLGSFLAVGTAFLLMISAKAGKGGLAIWPLFGATNQMLAALTLIIICVYLRKINRPLKSFLIPCLFLIGITTFGLGLNLKIFWTNNNIMLASFSTLLLLAQLWIIGEAMVLLTKKKKV